MINNDAAHNETPLVPDSPEARPPKRSSRKKAVGRYLLSLPERSARAAAAIVGGTLYETSNVALPLAVRQSKLYQVTLDRLLRIVIEWVGDVRNVYQDEETSVQELAARKFTGNVLEFASISAVGFSPLWILAAASDVMGGSKAYLRALVTELQASGQLPADSNVASYEDLLNRLEQGSGVLADTIDIPPMSVRDARASFDALRAQAHDLPPAETLAEIFLEMQVTAQEEGRSLSDVSAAVGLAAARAGLRLGNAHIFGFYRESFRAIQEEGLLQFLRRAATPYLTRAGKHFLPSGTTYTDRFFDYLAQRRGASSA